MLGQNAKRTNKRAEPRAIDMRKLSGIFLILIAMTAANSVTARESGVPNVYRVNWLLKVCRDGGFGTDATPPVNSSSNLCAGTVQGFVMGLRYGQLHRTGPDQPFNYWCAPHGTTTRQLVTVFVHWAERNPALENQGWAAGLVLAFREAWPCIK